MKVLITGGAGFIGSHTADALIARGVQVRLLDSLEEPVHPGNRPPPYLNPEVELIVGDVCDEGVLLAALNGVDAIYHFAAFQDYLPVFSRFFLVNAASTALIYELIVRERLPIKKVIVASSQAAMGEGLYEDAEGRRFSPDIRSAEQLAAGHWGVVAPEGYLAPFQYLPSDETISNPQNQYGLSKISQESIAIQMGRRYEIPSIALRYSIVQGPRQSFYNAYSGACRIFSLCFHEGKQPSIYEDGQQIRDFINIQDVVAANLLVLEDRRADYKVFNVGGGKAISVSEFASVVAEVFGQTNYSPQPSGQYRFGDTRHILSDINKLMALGWAPEHGVHESVAAYKSWLEQAASVADILQSAQETMKQLGVVRSVSSGE